MEAQTAEFFVGGRDGRVYILQKRLQLRHCSPAPRERDIVTVVYWYFVAVTTLESG